MCKRCCRELAALNGTLKDEVACHHCGQFGHRHFECPNQVGAFVLIKSNSIKSDQLNDEEPMLFVARKLSSADEDAVCKELLSGQCCTMQGSKEAHLSDAAAISGVDYYHVSVNVAVKSLVVGSIAWRTLIHIDTSLVQS